MIRCVSATSTPDTWATQRAARSTPSGPLGNERRPRGLSAAEVRTAQSRLAFATSMPRSTKALSPHSRRPLPIHLVDAGSSLGGGLRYRPISSRAQWRGRAHDLRRRLVVSCLIRADPAPYLRKDLGRRSDTRSHRQGAELRVRGEVMEWSLRPTALRQLRA